MTTFWTVDECLRGRLGENGMAKYTVSDVRKEVRRLDPKLKEDDRAFWAATVMLSALVVGANVRRLARFTGYGPEFIWSVRDNLRRGGIWRRDGRTRCEWGDPKNGGVAFWIDVAVAMGYLERHEA